MYMYIYVYAFVIGWILQNPIIRGNEQHISWEASRSNAINGGFLDAIHSQIKPCLGQTVIYGLRQSSRFANASAISTCPQTICYGSPCRFCPRPNRSHVRLNCNSGYNR